MTVDFVVHPLKGVNDIEFGMTAPQVRSKINAAPEQKAHRATSKEYPSDFYPDLGLFCDYDEEGHLETVEFVLAGRPFLGGVNILTLPFGLAADLLRRLDPQVTLEPDAAVSRRLSMAIWSSDLPDGDHVPVETFLVGRPGYYDDMD